MRTVISLIFLITIVSAYDLTTCVNNGNNLRCSNSFNDLTFIMDDDDIGVECMISFTQTVLDRTCSGKSCEIPEWLPILVKNQCNFGRKIYNTVDSLYFAILVALLIATIAMCVSAA